MLNLVVCIWLVNCLGDVSVKISVGIVIVGCVIACFVHTIRMFVGVRLVLVSIGVYCLMWFNTH